MCEHAHMYICVCMCMDVRGQSLAILACIVGFIPKCIILLITF